MASGKAKKAAEEPQETHGLTDRGEGSSSVTVDENPAALSMDARQERMRSLRMRMAESSKANRKAVASELSAHKRSNKVNPITARKLERAEQTLDEHEARERGEDYERTRSWAYTIDENERWEEKLKQKELKRDQGYIDPLSASERTYRRLVSQIRPDRIAHANGKTSEPSSSAMVSAAADDDVVARHDDLRYGMHKPDDAALDRVTAHLNAEAEVRSKRSRYRADDPDAEVSYINDKNRHYNKKLKRYYDKYTTTIRENFERGTAL